ncbi:opioid growth factor receptor conserved region-domain-containing protein [Mycena rosella]|uniref:Opioid growth factor receptor conserved region-domain-containing protein n=1 Tax=Mycena rosella TaxID=1033263 RepID=A0AAD7DP70_MYCRO|nr:opioid growth factor receptor conserved region-domain-containing protein [Mycena rosella]
MQLFKRIFQTPTHWRLLSPSQFHHKAAAAMPVPRDVQEFLDGYPRNGDDKKLTANRDFYLNKLPCSPDNLLVEEIHEQWQGDYNKLESKHGFIQWIFPIREHGMNYQSQPLQPHEIAAMKGDQRVLERLLASYRLMLDFYGMRLVSEETGAVDRSTPPRNYAARYHNLVHSSHNYLRISRILKCLSEFGFEWLNAGFLLHVLNEQSQERELNTPGLRSSMDRWWANCIRNEEEREWVGGIITKVRQEEGYVFTREMYTAALEQRLRTGSFRSEDMKVEL